MGVTGLWDILKEHCKEEDIKYLRGKRVAVDLSGWVVQAQKTKELERERCPHISLLFKRVSHLLLNGVHPIFVLEGKVPETKQAVFKKRNWKGKSYSDDSDVQRNAFDKILDQCRDFLESLGVPCVKSKGEAEALCGLLCDKGKVYGVMTSDSDAFLYGAHTVIRDFSEDEKHLRVYSLKPSEENSNLNRRNLVALALLLGSDNSPGGVRGIGVETVKGLLEELKGVDLLTRFLDWKEKSESELFPGLYPKQQREKHCSICFHFGSAPKHTKEGCVMCDTKISCKLKNTLENPCTCIWHEKENVRKKQKYEFKVYTESKTDDGFPNNKVVDEFLNFSDEIPDEDDLDWKCPDLQQFEVKASRYLSGAPSDYREIYESINELWRQSQQSRDAPRKSKSAENDYGENTKKQKTSND